MATKRDYYQVLGVDKKATAQELKAAYRKKALEFHPDRNKSADAETKFKEVNEAYEVLSDTQKRAQYDQFGHAATGAGGFNGFGGAGGFGGGPFTYTYTTSRGGGPQADFDFSDPFDIFESFFGGGFARAQARPRYSLKIDFMEAVTGAKRTIVHQGTSHTVDIPPGVDDGTRIRFKDFDVTMDVGTHPEFKRDGADIVFDYELSFVDAALGTTIEIPTVYKSVKVKIRPGTQPGSIIRLQGQGMPRVRGGGKGDQYVRLKITIPKNLNRTQKKLLQEFRESST